jgi:hypothetical protein
LILKRSNIDLAGNFNTSLYSTASRFETLFKHYRRGDGNTLTANPNFIFADNIAAKDYENLTNVTD